MPIPMGYSTFLLPGSSFYSTIESSSRSLSTCVRRPKFILCLWRQSIRLYAYTYKSKFTTQEFNFQQYMEKPFLMDATKRNKADSSFGQHKIASSPVACEAATMSIGKRAIPNASYVVKRIKLVRFKEKEMIPRKIQLVGFMQMVKPPDLPSNSFDLVSLAYVIHEFPTRAIVGSGEGSLRLLHPGGMLAITNNSPKSKIPGSCHRYCLHR
ncbi:hypothetical protein IFM89_031023 [Coptis chinensis]|uniref:Methyltransferase type 11 domain-containing protein n=1 Tax=Coptis chinensis TaxID=261450 RepID=A0A835H705_9MAGN|nr:hypothetical protein IFM89_031023 [Coptis chinensis]